MRERSLRTEKILDVVIHSQPVQKAISELANTIENLSDEFYRLLASNLITNPQPSALILRRFSRLQRTLYRSVDAPQISLPNAFSLSLDNVGPGYKIKALVFPPEVLLAPGASRTHHTYPGGLLLHTFLNMKTASLFQKVCLLSREERSLLITAQIVHDVAKVYLLRWQHNGLPSTEPKLAGTGAHHVLVLAEMMRRGAPPDLLRITASIHVNVWEEPDRVAQFLRIASLLSKTSPQSAGIFKQTKKWALCQPLNIVDVVARMAELAAWHPCVQAEAAVREALRRASRHSALGTDWPPPGHPLERWAQNLLLTTLTELALFQCLRKGERQFLQYLRRAKKHLTQLGAWPVDLIFETS